MKVMVKSMNFNNDALTKFIQDVYSKPNKTILSSKEIKQIEKLYKENYKTVNTFSEFLSLDPEIGKKIKRVNGVREEIKRQLKDKKQLQTGTICECVLAQTIANMYNLNCFADIFHTYVRDLPANILNRLRGDNNKILCRYIYYNKNDLTTFLIQYGNPTRYDADLYLDNKIVKLEFKDRVARAGERETAYDENGKLIYDEKFATQNSEYIPLIEKFNSETNMIDLDGNYKNFDEKSKRGILKSYFDNLGFEAFVSIDNKNQLIAITKDCVETQDGLEILSLKGSEIRNSGKNPYAVFTPILLETSINKINGIMDGEDVIIPVENMLDRKNNGKITGKKINRLFFVFLKDIKKEGENYVFKLNKVRQLKPTLSAHVRVIITKEELSQYYIKNIGE